MELTTIKNPAGLLIKTGQKRRYVSKSHAGVGPVTAIAQKATGVWVTINDAKRGKYVTVRPSQVSAA